MSDFIRLIDRHAMPSGTGRAFTVGRYDIALFNIGGEYFALENACPHQGGPIADGWIDGQTVTCPWHAWCFDLRSGKMTLGDFAWIPRFEVRIEGDNVLVSTEPMPS